MTAHRVPTLPKDMIECRRKKAVSLSDIAAATKIGLRYLEAIEHGNFKGLPGGVYNLSYIRQYARAVGYDENALVEYYREVAEPEPEPVIAPPIKDSFARRFRYRVSSRLASLGRHAVASGIQK